MINICFVCTGNTCRSIMAERLMKQILKEKKIKDIKVISRGINANGENISENAKIVLKKMHASATNRKSIKLGKTKNDVLYIAMTDAHKKYINAQKVISFQSLIGKDVIDPYGQNEEVYLETAKEIKQGIENLLKKIQMWR